MKTAKYTRAEKRLITNIDKFALRPCND